MRQRGFPTRAAALAAKHRQELILNGWLSAEEPEPLTWAEVIQEFGVELAGSSHAHQREAVAILGRLGAFAKAKRAPLRVATDFTPELARRYMASLDGLSAASRRKHYVYLARIGSWLERNHYASNPMAGLAKPREQHRLKSAPGVDDWLELLRAVPAAPTLTDRQGWHVLILLAVVTGLRRTTLLDLPLSAIDFETDSDGAGVLKSWSSKTGKERLHGLPKPAMQRLAYRVESLPDGGGLFPHWGTWPRKQWDQLREAAGFRFDFHGLRRAAGTQAALQRLRAAGAEALDHSSERVFEAHYESHRRVALELATAMKLPRLPKCPPPG